ncbi:hypothetical protein Micbo1qcDRAFT_210097 [Microdochium bolleyi]|uniref:Uncharacterized protein n=1 Tax=Microdochium bolleyi TaxID=196109 RepID=A0A136IK24_9PEZI|nr:hypothetical protein Micbo1qcDRAFT_210097 [Microdochium bolleyi]
MSRGYRSGEALRYSVPMEPMYIDRLSLRSVHESLLKSAAMSIVAAGTYGHLLSLRGCSSRDSTGVLLQVVVSIMFPTLPVAQLLRHIKTTVVARYRGQVSGETAIFYASAILGIRASTQAGESVPVFWTQKSRRSVRQKGYDSVWMGRMTLALVLLTQYCSTLYLWVRRAYVFADSFRLWAIDNRDLEVVLGGVVAVCCSLVITVMNAEWDISGSPAPAPPQSRMTGFVFSSSNVPPASSNTPVSPRPRKLARFRAAVINKSRTIYDRLIRSSVFLSGWIQRRFPAGLRRDFELAYLLHIIFYSFVAMQGSGMDDEPVSLRPLSDLQRSLLYAASKINVFVEGTSAQGAFLAFMYLLPAVTISIKMVLDALPAGTFISKMPYWYRQLWTRAAPALTVARAVAVVPLLLSMLLPVALQWVLVAKSVEDLHRVEYSLEATKHFGLDESAAWRLWQDPLAGKLFLL